MELHKESFGWRSEGTPEGMSSESIRKINNSHKRILVDILKGASV